MKNYSDRPFFHTKKLEDLGKRVCDLVERSAEGKEKNTYVLPRGGGRGTCLHGQFSYWLAKLYNNQIFVEGPKGFRPKYTESELVCLDSLSKEVEKILK